MTKNAVLTINPGAYLDALRTLKRAEGPAERYKPHPLDVEKAAETVENVNARAAATLDFSGNTAEWQFFCIEEVDQDGEFVAHHGGYGIDIDDIRRSLTERNILLQNAIDFAVSCTSEEDPDGLTVIGDPFFHNCRWLMEVGGVNGRRYIGLNASGGVEFAEY